MSGMDFLRWTDRVMRVTLAAQALLLVVLTALLWAKKNGWISYSEFHFLSLIFGPELGWELPILSVTLLFTLFYCLLFTVIVLIVRSLLLLFGIPFWGLRWWIILFGFQLLALTLNIYIVF